MSRLSLLLPFLLTSSLCAQVILSEFGASSNDRVFSRDANGNAVLGAGLQWWDVDYDDSFWRNGTSPIGFGFADIATDVRGEVQGRTPTLYMRQSFTRSAGQANTSQTLSLRMDYSDGFIAYLNGREIARADMAAPGSPIYPSQVSYNSNTPNGTGGTITIGPGNQYLRAGENILAIEVHNNSLTSGSLKSEPTLFVGNTTLISNTADCLWFPGLIMPSGGIFDPAFTSSLSALKPEWAAVDFDDTAWATGLGPIGADRSTTEPYDLGTNLEAALNNTFTSVYMRRSFEVTQNDIANLTNLELEYDFDDGCIIYLNGVEVFREALGAAGQFIPFNQNADSGNGASTDNGNPFVSRIFNLDPSLLTTGTNVLSAQVHNSSPTSSDLIMHLGLRSSGGSTQTFVAPTEVFSYFVGTQEPSDIPAESISPDLEYSDWIELKNTSNQPVNLSGWHLSDDIDEPTKFSLPAGAFIPANGYLLVLADDQDEFNGEGDFIHTSFRLSANGDDLVLANPSGTVVDSFVDYPRQSAIRSFGFDQANQIWGYYDFPTPGFTNSTEINPGRVDAPDFSPKGGFYDTTQTVILTTETPGATIRYTTDGSDPTLTNGFTYTGPLSLARINERTAHAIRARAFQTNMADSNIKTANFLIDQAAGIETVAALMFTEDERETFYDEHGIMTIEGGEFRDVLADPTRTRFNWFENGPDSYNIPGKRGPEYERPLHIEFYRPDASLNFREDGGIRLSSSSFSRPQLRLTNVRSSPWVNDSKEKPSFNLYFRGDYGVDALESDFLGEDYPVSTFEQLRVRAGKNDIRNPFITDEVARRLYGAMGQASSHGVFNSVYMNGDYKGFFNMCERIREPFLQQHHGGREEWDVRQVRDFPNGDSTAWDTMLAILQRGNGDLSLSDWEDALEFLDPINTADYFLFNVYAAMWDWPQNNWIGARERSPEGQYRLYVWDAEGGFSVTGRNEVDHDTFSVDLFGKNNPLTQFFQGLHRSPEWRLIFADRIQKHLFNGGVLDHRNTNNNLFRTLVTDLRDQAQPIINYQLGGSLNTSFYDEWVDPLEGRRRVLFGAEGASPRNGDRTDFEDRDLWPSLRPPAFSQHGGALGSAQNLTIATVNGGTIYFTTDGSDPRQLGGAIQSGLSPYNGGFTLSPGRTTVKARTRNGNTWSALTEAEFTVDLAPASASNLVISEFLYNPADPSAIESAGGFNDKDDFEFIELLNISNTDTIDLSNLAFTDGIDFQFSNASLTDLGPGQRVLIVSNRLAFEARYGAGNHPVIGVYNGGLSNGGEQVTLSRTGASPAVIRDFTYDDSSPWPACADGPGGSLVLNSPQNNPDHALPTSWSCSQNFGGDLNGTPLEYDYNLWSQFRFDANQLGSLQISGAGQDPDGDGLSNFIEFALGSDPNQADSETFSPKIIVVTENGIEYPALNFTRNGFAQGVSFNIRASNTLRTGDWSILSANQVDAAPSLMTNEGLLQESWRIDRAITSDPSRFFQLQISN